MGQELLKWARGQKVRGGALRKVCFDFERELARHESDAEYFECTADPAMFVAGLAVRRPDEAAELMRFLASRRAPELARPKGDGRALAEPARVPGGWGSRAGRNPRKRCERGLLGANVESLEERISGVESGRLHPLVAWELVIEIVRAEAAERKMPIGVVASEMMDAIRARVSFEEWLSGVVSALE